MSISRSLSALLHHASSAQPLWGVGLATLFAFAWYTWNTIGRTHQIAIGIAGVAFLVILLRFPFLGTMLVVTLMTSGVTKYLPAGLYSPLLILIVFVVAVRKFTAGDFTFRVTPILFWTVLFYTWEWMSFLWAPADNPLNPVGITNFIRNILVLVVITWTVETPHQYRTILIAAITGSAVSAILTIHSFYTLLSSGSVQELANSRADVRFSGGYDDPNIMADSILPFIGAAYIFVRSKGPAWLRGLATAVCLLGLVAIAMTLSRGAMILLFLLVGALVLAERHRWLVLFIICGIVSIIAFVSPTDTVGRLGTIGKGRGDASIAQRTDLFIGGLRMAWDHLPLGVGLGNFAAYSMDYVYSQDHGFVAHDSYVDTIAETGPIGLFLMLAMLGSLVPALRIRRWKLTPDDASQNFGILMIVIYAFMIISLAHYSLVHYTLYVMIGGIISVRPIVYSSTDSTSTTTMSRVSCI